VFAETACGIHYVSIWGNENRGGFDRISTFFSVSFFTEFEQPQNEIPIMNCKLEVTVER